MIDHRFKKNRLCDFVFLSIHNDIWQLVMPPPLIARLENLNRIKYVKKKPNSNYLYILIDLHKAWLEICWHDQVTPQLKS